MLFYLMKFNQKRKNQNGMNTDEYHHHSSAFSTFVQIQISIWGQNVPVATMKFKSKYCILWSLSFKSFHLIYISYMNSATHAYALRIVCINLIIQSPYANHLHNTFDNKVIFVRNMIRHCNLKECISCLRILYVEATNLWK